MEERPGSALISWLLRHTSTIVLGVFVVLMILIGRFVLISADSYHPTSQLGGGLLVSSPSPVTIDGSSPDVSPSGLASPALSPSPIVTASP